MKTFCLVGLMLCHFKSLAQESNRADADYFYKKTFFYDQRGVNVIELAVGTSNINGDLPSPIFEIASRIGYKHFMFPHLNIGFTYNKFNIAFEDVYNEGFMSFDLNLEYVASPYQSFSPFLFAGGGYNASNYFVQTATKFQGGGGVEIIVATGFGLKIMADYNYVMSDELDGVVFGASDDAYWRVLFGANFYFGGQNKKERILKGVPTIINSNPIIKEN
ncbi:Curli production assembly/transport component CsgG [Gelidibacter sp.]|uniref:Curli production assembly/transport component CsgG n=1 Tax=Gelidibacter sp. TaxID=2018083 RepID=UPI002D7FF12A|nr:Curli production assembly/transport component CsgG [Gelidibacter sp.]